MEASGGSQLLDISESTGDGLKRKVEDTDSALPLVPVVPEKRRRVAALSQSQSQSADIRNHVNECEDSKVERGPEAATDGARIIRALSAKRPVEVVFRVYGQEDIPLRVGSYWPLVVHNQSTFYIGEKTYSLHVFVPEYIEGLRGSLGFYLLPLMMIDFD